MWTRRPADGARRITRLALLTAIALTIFMAEAQDPGPHPHPWGSSWGWQYRHGVRRLCPGAGGTALLILVTRVFWGRCSPGR